MTQEHRYMLMFSLGPVQALIAQARKTRDLWLGSFLLSKLMEAAMEKIDKQAFVFPTEQTIDGWIPDLPNKYIAIFDTSDAAKKAVCQSEQQIRARWESICKQIGKEILGKYYTPRTEEDKNTATSKIWHRQTNFSSFFEIYWVVVAGSEVDYPGWLKATQAAHDARKRLRNFPAQDEPGEKSTISGEREALSNNGKSRRNVQKFWKDLTEGRSANDISKDGSERLDAIDTIKRFALYSSELEPSSPKGQKREFAKITFPSTSSIATAPFIIKLLTSDLSDTDPMLKQWRQVTDNGLSYENPSDIPYLKKLAEKRHRLWVLQRDGDCYFPETFTPRHLKECYGITFDPEETKASGLIWKSKTFTQGCLDALKGLHLTVKSQPTPYYALVQMDGDKMGTLMSGVQTKVEHQDISNALSNFARKQVPRIVQEEHPGRLVYAGGDDVLAFTPLDGMLDMADNLQKQYVQNVKEKVKVDDKEKVAASMGIAIGHHLTPLSIVRRAALDAEKLAKNHYGRNALVITILRHSGEQTRVGCRWYYRVPLVADISANEQTQEDCHQHNGNLDKCDDKLIKPIALFKNFYNYFVGDLLSPKSIHVLLDEASTLVGLKECAQISEIKRVLKRQSNDPKPSNADEKKLPSLDELATQVVQLACAMDQISLEKHKQEDLSIELHSDKLRRGLVEVFGWLLVMAFLAREGLENENIS